MILISHDRHLIEACVERLWLVHDGTVQPYDDDLDAYRRLILKGPDKASEPAQASASQANQSQKDRRKQAAARRSEFAPLKKKIDALEKRIDKAQGEISAIDTDMTKPDILGDSQKIVGLSKKRSELESNVAAWEEEWMTLSAEYEEAMADA